MLLRPHLSFRVGSHICSEKPALIALPTTQGWFQGHTIEPVTDVMRKGKFDSS